MPSRLRIPHHTPLDMADPKTAPDTHPKGRRCRTCGTTLSRYNPDDSCFRHPKRRPLKRQPNSRDQRESREDFIDLMSRP